MKTNTLASALVYFLIFLSGRSVLADEQDRLVCEHADVFEAVKEGDEYVVHAVGDVVFKTKSGRIYCDSALWRKGENVRLNGHVRMDDTTFQITADSVFYDIGTGKTDAWGEQVVLWSYRDSIYAVGPHSFYDKKNKYFYMDERPLLYLRYPDTANMVEVLADSIEYLADSSKTVATGDVVITSTDLSSQSGKAIMNTETNVLELLENPTARHRNSEVSGRVITLSYEGDLIRSIVVTDSARAELKEPIDSLESDFDESILSGQEIVFSFEDGLLDNILCYGQAYSWYYPSPRGGGEFNENSVSGDSIRLLVHEESLEAVHVNGGAIGSYLTGKIPTGDTLVTSRVDTVDYQAMSIEYNLEDSLIILRGAAGVTSASVSLAARMILFDTRQRVIEAFSADVLPDSTYDEDSYSARIQPNNIPVLLKDGDDVVEGNYLEYSIDTEKGRIVHSKSDYEAGFYYGQKLFREQRNIYYIDGGRYTTCDASEPHFHFHSSHLKLIEGDKLIAKPVVFYLGRLPLVAIPYYVFPLKKGRHSGFLPFTFGNFERGVRYVRNVGYYWAASEYWDWLGSMDYYENLKTFTLNTKLRFARRYVVENTYLSGSYTKVSSYNRTEAQEGGRKRWVVKGSYNHKITPSFSANAYGQFQSDKSYYTDYSPNLEERLSRVLTSKATLSKMFGKNTSLRATFSHVVNLDTETRTDNIPSATLSLPVLYPFGDGCLNEEGNLEQKWYHNFKIRYSPSLLNYSSRKTPKDSIIADTTVVTDTIPDADSLIITEETIITKDTIYYRSRRKYARIQHSPTVYLPTISLGSYLNIIPKFSYRETWFKIYKTDQSEEEGIDPDTYRTHSWNTGVSANTKLYGTVYPKLFGVTGLRHVVTPAVSYAYSPDIDEHPDVRRYAGGGAGSKKSSIVSFSLAQDFQAKIKRGEGERSIPLLSMSSGFNYNFENDEKPFSNLTTSYRSDAVPNLHIDGSITHSLYEPDTDNLSFWSPYKTAFSFNANLNLNGMFPLFDEPVGIPRGADSASQLTSSSQPSQPAVKRGGWSCRLYYRYSETGRAKTWSKKNSFFVQLNVNFNLTRSTTVSYSQRYDLLEAKTINNSVNIVRKIHCWTGSLFWVPIGSNRGFGFKLFVTDLPEIKIDNSHDDFVTGLQRYR